MEDGSSKKAGGREGSAESFTGVPPPELMSARTQRTRGEEALETQLVRR